MSEHTLIGNTLVTEPGGIVARCSCGWVSKPHFSSMSASVAFRVHQEEQMRAEHKQITGDA